MAELREAHLRYLLAIYELGKSTPDVGTQAVAKALNCSKASVTKMMATLMDMNLLVREKYGKIYLTDTGFLLAKDMLQCIELIRERLPAMGFDLTEEEVRDFVRTMVVNLPEHCRRRLVGIIFRSDKQPRLAEALRRCAIWRRVFRNDKECDP